MVDHKKRDFLQITAGVLGAAGAISVAWPFLKQLGFGSKKIEDYTLDVDVSSLKPGMSITVKWLGKPVFIKNRTPQEMLRSKKTRLQELKDPWSRNPNEKKPTPATDLARSGGINHENWLVMIELCTHLGCVPVGLAGEFGGWFCPCHGSVYDTAGRVRRGPASENMAIPPYHFISENIIRIGELKIL